jgi:hypothetical protein
LRWFCAISVETKQGKFLRKKKKSDGSNKLGHGTRDKWYDGTLTDIANHMGKREEYDFFVSTLHGCVHSSAFAVQKPPISAQHVLHWASKIAMHVAKINAQYNKIHLNENYQQIMDELCKNLLQADINKSAGIG